MDWTPEQKKVIDTREKNILVSAAAGSGKTAVLVERIINRILDKENPAGIDRMLVVTFTKAAAAEMRERIMKAIMKASSEDPENEYLQKQITYIHNAKITTIDSFCKSIVKDNFNKLDIDPSFRIANEDELALIKYDVMEEVFEEYFSRGDKAFLDFVETRGGKNFEDALSDIVLQLYKYSQSNPYPEKWLEDCLKVYDTSDFEKENVWVTRMDNYILESLEVVNDSYEKAIKLCIEDHGPKKYMDLFETEKGAVVKCLEAENYYDRAKLILDIVFNRLPSITKKDVEVEPELKEQAKGFRDLCKDRIKELYGYCYDDKEVLKHELKENYKIVKVITDLVKDFTVSFGKYKRDRNMADFNDLEHMALNILTKQDENGDVIPSEIALELSENYDEIMIDEYQDSNLVQEYLLTAVSGISNGKNNMFMVGDVKQSIYKFRMAKPELFLSKYDSFPTKDDGDDIRITLGMNFRSRKEVVNSVNLIFEQIMGKNMGGIEYDKDHTLCQGAKYNTINKDCKQNTEIIIIEKSEDSDEKIKLEANVIAGKIKEMMNNGFMVTDKATGEARALRYSDIAILVRSISNGGEEINDVLMENGIPSYVEKNTGYFDTLEISSILNMLSIIDNPHQDIPLAAVLKNIFLFKPSEMAVVAMDREGDLYDGIINFLEKNENSEDEKKKNITLKLRKVITIVNEMRKKSKYMSISDIIREILEETGYKYYVAAMASGDRRMTNIRMLLKKADDYEKTSFTGLFNFIRYISNIKKYEVEIGEASNVSESDDSIKIMTIHKSKGLEFPVVFVSRTSKQFNNKSYIGAIVVHEKYGIGLDYIDVDRRTKKGTCVKKFIADQIKKDDMAEELRVLYVALTRAKEKLIITGMADTEKLFEKLELPKTMESDKFDRDYLMSCKSYFDWIMASVIRNKEIYKWNDGEHFPVFSSVPILSPHFLKDVELNFNLITENTIVESRVLDNVYADLFEQTFSKENINKCLEVFQESDDVNPCKYFDAKYKYEADTKLNSKYSVSEIKKMIYEEGVDEEDESQVMLYRTTHKKESYVPSFIKAKEKLEGAGRGTAYHRIFELIDYSGGISDAEAIAEQIDKLLKDGYIDKSVAEVVEPESIYKFICSDIGRRMENASKSGKLFREQQYVMGVKASDIHNDYKGDEMVLVQGAIDAYIIEDGEVTIIDYKTDNVREPEQLVTLYKGQLDYYGKAIERVTGMKVKEKIIYSVKFGKELSV